MGCCVGGTALYLNYFEDIGIIEDIKNL